MSLHHYSTGHSVGPADMSRRYFFSECRLGLAPIALASLFGGGVAQAAANVVPTPAGNDFPPRAKRVIYLFMAGAPSQLDLFDYKPRLTELEGKPIPPEVIAGQRYAFIQPDAAVLGPRFKFARHGESGAELSEVLPHLAKVVDDVAFVRSVHTDLFNHAPAQLFVNTGSGIPGRPGMGAWLSYGLGSESRNLPAFVVLKSGGSLSGGAAMWSNGFLPGKHQGVPFRSQGDPILQIANPAGIDPRAQRETLDLVNDLNRQRADLLGDPQIATRIEAGEMAFRMQSHAPRADGLFTGDGGDAGDVRSEAGRRRTRVREQLPAGAAARGARGCGSFRCTMPAGTITARWRAG
ncbi:MAG: DUF1501 domain-containing protein [Planctomycetaceae bacterium]